MFFPFVGLALSVSWAIGLLAFRLIDSGTISNKKLLWVLVLLLLPVACGYGTWKRNIVWHNEHSLWENVTDKKPKKRAGHDEFW